MTNTLSDASHCLIYNLSTSITDIFKKLTLLTQRKTKYAIFDSEKWWENGNKRKEKDIVEKTTKVLNYMVPGRKLKCKK